MSTVHIIYTIALLALFLGIVAWAFSAARGPGFERAAHSVLNDAEPRPGAPGSGPRPEHRGG